MLPGSPSLRRQVRETATIVDLVYAVNLVYVVDLVYVVNLVYVATLFSYEGVLLAELGVQIYFQLESREQ